MSAAVALQRAVAAALAPLGVTVFDAPPVRGAVPHLVVAEPVLADASVAGWTGREGRLTVALHDEGERPLRLRTLAGRAEARMAAMLPEIGDGWRLTVIRLARGRMAREGRDRWVATLEMRVRLWRAEEEG